MMDIMTMHLGFPPHVGFIEKEICENMAFFNIFGPVHEAPGVVK